MVAHRHKKRGIKLKSEDVTTVINSAADHHRIESLQAEIKALKSAIWKESMTAITQFEKILDAEDDRQKELAQENLVYAIGKIKAMVS